MASLTLPLYVICIGILSFVESFYDPYSRYNARFYYMLSDSCPISRSNDESRYLDIYSDTPSTLSPTLRVLSVESEAGPADFTYESQFTLNNLEIYVMKGRVHRFKILAPNLRAFSIIDTNNVHWTSDSWYFPRLRVFNLMTVKLASRDWISIPTFGSKELEILRMTRLEHSSFMFNFSDAFANLRILEISQLGLTQFEGLCEFLAELKHLESLLIGNVDDLCIIDSLRKLRPYGKLKRVRLLGNGFHIPDETICFLFTPTIEHLHMSFENGPKNLGELKCYSQLKTLVAQVNPKALATLDTEVPSVYLCTAADAALPQEDRESIKKLKLPHARSVVIDRLATYSNSVPEAPLAVTLRFNGNGFHFDPTEEVQPFPNHRNVRLLDLSDNPITMIPRNAFDSLPNLAIIVLQDTKLQYFDDLAFCRLRWPRVVNFGKQMPDYLALRDPPLNASTTERWNSLKCLMDPSRQANLIYLKENCSCSMKPYHYLELEDRQRLVVNDDAYCTNMGQYPLIDFYEKSCKAERAVPPMERVMSVQPAGLCKESARTFMLFFCWVCYMLFCWIPPVVLYILHRKKLRRNLIKDQRTNTPKSLFIICPRHARQWCKKVIIPCLEADLFAKRAPRIRPIRAERPPRDKNQHNKYDEQDDQHIQSSLNNSNKKPLLHGKTKQNVVVPSRLSARTGSSASSLPGVGEPKPRGPWAWQPRFKCHLAPPARHRLGLMMDSYQVLILFPSPSLFTEPACRAQIRLAFHLCRLGRMSPPAIVVWPAGKSHQGIAANYRSVNRNRTRLDEDKYYTAPAFGSVTNDPEDIAETAVIKAKVPSREEAMEIMQYFSTLTSPCIHWSNGKTVRKNLEPLVWWLNRASQIPAY